jgi:hypothetical protein
MPAGAEQGERAVNKQDFTTSFSVDQTRTEAFDAINNVRRCWSEELEGAPENSAMSLRFITNDVHRSVN